MSEIKSLRGLVNKKVWNRDGKHEIIVLGVTQRGNILWFQESFVDESL